MSKATLEREVRHVVGRLRRRALFQNLTLVWLAACAVAWVVFLVVRSQAARWPGAWLLGGTLAAAAVVAAISWWRRGDPRATVAEIERTHPELETKLLAAYDLEQKLPLGGRGYLEEQVVQEARIHSLTHRRWDAAAPARQLTAWTFLQFGGLALWTATLAVQYVASRQTAVPTAAANDATTTVAEDSFAVTVEPGNIELERGSDLLVLARFADKNKLPRDVTLLTVDSAGEKKLPLTQSLSDPIFAGRVPEVRSDLTYRLAFADEPTQTFTVTVFDYPELQRADAELNYPSYTQLPSRKVEDVRHLSVVEGTEIRLLCRMNKRLKSARLAPTKEGEPLELLADGADPLLYTVAFVPTKSVRYRLELADDRDRTNRQEAEFAIDVVPNRPPDLKLVFPRKDLKVSPLQEVPLEAEVADDFGVLRWGLAFEMPGKKAESVTLGEKLPAKEKSLGKQLIALEELKAQPDELLAYHVWAEDVGPDGKPRRTTSDIYFAEVSPFEEIFRSGEAGGGMPGAGKPEATDASLKLQKEIIAATWNLRRRETDAKPSAAYADDVKAIADSQQKALDGLAAMREKLQTPEANKTIDEIEQEMKAALNALLMATAANALPPLDEALPHEQAAYQSLLKLRARETRIMKSKNAQGGGGGQQSASGQELDQLEMKEDAERYETRNRAADPKQSAAEKEREEFLSRLRELARRQEDMNQKIKELQAALDAAKNEEEKKQIERQLKRLRDEQREMLRDVDELQNNLAAPKHNAPQTAAEKQLEQTRENVRQASDALEKGKTQEALTAGKRAESELDKLREDFRKQTANQFAEEVRDLVDRAQKLDERQQQINEQLTGKRSNPDDKSPGDDKKPTKNTTAANSKPDAADATEKPAKPTQPGLRGGAASQGNQLPAELADQRRELNDVLEKARDLTQRAEGAEPLLSKQLYDTVREAHQKQTSRAVELMQQLVAGGLPTEAARVAPQAEQGVKQLRDGIEKAAEGILGDDVESLRRAKQEVDRLAQALAEEIARENPAAAPQRKPSEQVAAAAGKPSPAAADNNSNKPNDAAQSGSPQQLGPGEAARPGPNQSGKSAKSGDDKPSADAQPSTDGSANTKPSNDVKSPDTGKDGGKKPGNNDAPASPQDAKPNSQPGKQSGQSGKEAGQKPGEQPGSNSSEGKQPGDGQGQQPGQQPGQASGATPGQTAGQGKQPGKGSPGLRGGNAPAASGSGDTSTEPQPNQPFAPQSQPGERTANSANGGTSGPHGVINGPDWRDWNDALRNLEEFVPGVRLRGDAARVREQAQALRAEAKRHSQTPNWELVRETVYEPLLELQRQLDEELMRRESPQAAVPLDRDPVPERFGEAVRKYYERLGSGR